jgi:hypothetical protein
VISENISDFGVVVKQQAHPVSGGDFADRRTHHQGGSQMKFKESPLAIVCRR